MSQHKCSECGHPLNYGDWPFCGKNGHEPARTRNAEWTDADAVVVFRKPDGSISYPGRNDKPTPPGCERVVMKSLRAVEKFERENGVRNEAMWFDRNGRGFDTHFKGERLDH